MPKPKLPNTVRSRSASTSTGDPSSPPPTNRHPSPRPTIRGLSGTGSKAAVLGLALLLGLGCGGDSALPTGTGGGSGGDGGDDGGGGGGGSEPSSRLVTDLEPASYERDTLETGISVYVDREYTVDELPSRFVGGTYVRTANDDKSGTSDSAVAFELTDTATVAVAYDQRATQLPGWLDGWTATGEVMTTTDVDYDIYTRNLEPGPVALGGNLADGAEGAESMYVVSAMASDSVPDNGGGGSDSTDTTGALEATTSTTGDSLDPDGYTVTVDGGSGQSIGINDTTTFEDLGVEDHSVELSGMASNCSVSGENPRTVAVPEDDTASTTFEVACEATSGGDDGDMDKMGAQWSYVEWSLENTSYSGNPFDLVATVTFTHDASGEQRTTEMFYAGQDTWKFRFTGTRTGTWSFTTESSDPELDGRSGTVDISPNSDPDIRGFLTTRGNKFARQVGGGQLEPIILSIFQDHNFDVFNDFGYGPGWFDENALFYGDEAHLQAQMQKAFDHGANAVFLREITNEWFELGAYGHDEHSSVNPDLRTFEALETAITTVHAMGGILHLWAWGDESRSWTPVGVPGGINGEIDRRLQRYIAARLGPLPGWTMSYGFDLDEWVTPSEVDAWASYMKDHFGWNHLLMARNQGGVDYNGPDLDVQSFGGEGPANFSEALDHVNPDKPHLEEERFWYQRTFGGATYTMDHTMDLMWWMAMAGGSAGFWGTQNGGPEYPNPEWMRTYATFWQNYFLFGLEPANGLTDGYGLATSDRSRYVFFKEGTSSIEMDLSGMSGSQSAIAVDTRAPYQEIDLGTLDPGTVTWNAPHTSDWAIAVGQ